MQFLLQRRPRGGAWAEFFRLPTAGASGFQMRNKAHDIVRKILVDAGRFGSGSTTRYAGQRGLGVLNGSDAPASESRKNR